MELSDDVSGGYSDYRKAVKNEQLAKMQLDRAKLLYDDGAIPKSNLEVAQNADDNAQVDLDTSLEHLRLLGADPDHPPRDGLTRSGGLSRHEALRHAPEPASASG